VSRKEVSGIIIIALKFVWIASSSMMVPQTRNTITNTQFQVIVIRRILTEVATHPLVVSNLIVLDVCILSLYHRMRAAVNVTIIICIYRVYKFVVGHTHQKFRQKYSQKILKYRNRK